MPRKLRNKPLTREDIKREQARCLLVDVYYAAVARWKDRLSEKQNFANRLLILSGRVPLLHGTGGSQNCPFKRKAYQVVLRNELNGDAVAYQFPQRASTAHVFEAARMFLKVPDSIPLRLWLDLPWIGRAEEDALPSTDKVDTVRYLANTTIVVLALNHKITRDPPDGS